MSELSEDPAVVAAAKGLVLVLPGPSRGQRMSCTCSPCVVCAGRGHYFVASIGDMETCDECNGSGIGYECDYCHDQREEDEYHREQQEQDEDNRSRHGERES